MAIIYSKGFQQSITNDGSKSKPVINVIEWDSDADYKNNKGTMNVAINKNGKKNKYQVKLKKNDLEKLFKMPTINQSLEQRLKNDFAMLESSNPPNVKKNTKTRKNMNIPKSNRNNNNNNNINNNNINNNEYDDLEKLFTLRKKLMTPYHVTHNKTHQKSRKAQKSKKAQKSRKAQKSNKNFFTQFF
jgi:hypothetical protein